MSNAVRLLHPRRNISLAVQHAPYINMVRTFYKKHDVRVARQWPGAQTGQIEFVGVARGASARVAADMSVVLRQRVDETQRSLLSLLTQVVGNGLVNISVGLLTWDDCFDLHP